MIDGSSVDEMAAVVASAEDRHRWSVRGVRDSQHRWRWGTSWSEWLGDGTTALGF